MSAVVDLTLLTGPALIASIVAGLVSGAYLVAIHPPVDTGYRRRAVLFGWFLGFPFSILYLVRIAIGQYRVQTEGLVTDLPRLTAGWLLALVFALFVVAGAALGFRLRGQLARRRIRRALDSARKLAGDGDVGSPRGGAT